MIAILAIGVGLGWRIDRAGRQKRAVARIEKSGGIVLHDFEFDGTYPYKPGGKPRGRTGSGRGSGMNFSRK